MRKYVDCRDAPSVSGCSLRIAGEEAELLQAAIEHARSVHGHPDSPELRAMLRAAMKDEIEPTRREPPRVPAAPPR